MQFVADLNDLRPVKMYLMNVANKEFRSNANCQSGQSQHCSQNNFSVYKRIIKIEIALQNSTDAGQTEQKRYEILISVRGEEMMAMFTCAIWQ